MSRHVDDLLARRPEEPLRPAEESAVASHLAGCVRCRGLAGDLERADALLSTGEPPLALPAPRARRARGSPVPLTSALVVVIALAAGIGLAQLRSDLAERAANPSAAPPTVPATTAPPAEPVSLYRPARDLVYVEDGSGGRGGLNVIAMPDGRVIEEFDFAAVSGSRDAMSPPHVSEEFAFFARTVAEETRVFRTSLERIDLATGERRSVGAGTVDYAGPIVIGDHEVRTEDMSEEEIAGRLRTFAEGVARSYGQVVTSPDASNVLLIRPQAGASSTIRVDRYDGRSLEHLGTRIWTGAASPERFFPLDGSGFLAVSYEHPDIFSRRDTWTFLDRELREIASVTGATSADWPNYCAADLQALPDGRTWVTICDRHERTYFLQLIDRERLTDAGKVELTGGVRYPAAILAWDVAADGTINVLTDRPSLIRVDPVARRVTDHRLITSSEAPRQAGPIESKPSPRIQFSADGRLVYVAHLGFGGRLGGAPLSLIDVASGHVVATLEGGGVTGLKLSADGARLYVIRDGRLVLLDPGTLRVVSATEPIVTPPGALLIVAPRD